jgi:hypothetical protein
VGVRPRGDRIEITVDFTPSAELMIATGTLITGIVREVMTWPSFRLTELEAHDIPVIDGYHPVPHTTRKGWLAHFDCYPANPFTCDIDADSWTTRSGQRVSLRTIAGRITRVFWRSIRRLSDPFTFRLIGSVMRGRAPSLLDLPDRPPEYEDVGRLCDWDDLFPPNQLRRSRYERVLIRAISGQKLRLFGHWFTPVGMRGWSQVVFKRDGERSQHYFSIDYLLHHLDDWEKAARSRPRSLRKHGRGLARTEKWEVLMLELVGFAAAWSAAIIGFVKTREFVRNRLRYVDAVHRTSAPLKAGGAALLLATPIVLPLPVVGVPTAILFGVAVGAGVVAGRRDIRRQLPAGTSFTP